MNFLNDIRTLYIYTLINKSLRPPSNDTILKLKTTHYQVIYERLTQFYSQIRTVFISSQIVQWFVFCMTTFALDYCLDVACQVENQFATIVKWVFFFPGIFNSISQWVITWMLLFCNFGFGNSSLNSIGLKSGLFLGQSSVVTLILFQKFWMTFDWWHGTPSCINIVY